MIYFYNRNSDSKENEKEKNKNNFFSKLKTNLILKVIPNVTNNKEKNIEIIGRKDSVHKNEANNSDYENHTDKNSCLISKLEKEEQIPIYKNVESENWKNYFLLLKTLGIDVDKICNETESKISTNLPSDDKLNKFSGDFLLSSSLMKMLNDAIDNDSVFDLAELNNISNEEIQLKSNTLKFEEIHTEDNNSIINFKFNNENKIDKELGYSIFFKSNQNEEDKNKFNSFTYTNPENNEKNKQITNKTKSKSNLNITNRKKENTLDNKKKYDTKIEKLLVKNDLKENLPNSFLIDTHLAKSDKDFIINNSIISNNQNIISQMKPQVNQINMINPVFQVNHLNNKNSINQINHINPINPINHIDQYNQYNYNYQTNANLYYNQINYVNPYNNPYNNNYNSKNSVPYNFLNYYNNSNIQYPNYLNTNSNNYFNYYQTQNIYNQIPFESLKTTQTYNKDENNSRPSDLLQKSKNTEKINLSFSSNENEVLENAKDLVLTQSGCRFLQDYMKNKEKFSLKLLEVLKPIMWKLIKDSFGNYLFQKIIEILPKNSLTNLSIEVIFFIRYFKILAI